MKHQHLPITPVGAGWSRRILLCDALRPDSCRLPFRNLGHGFRWGILITALMVLLAASNAFAATNYVLLTDDLQARINASTNGDTLVVQEGVYSGNLVFNKPLTILRSGTNEIIRLDGSVQVLGTGAVSFAQCVFSSSVQVQCAGTVSFAQCLFRGPITSQAATLLLSQVTCSNTLTANLSTGTGTNLQAYDSVFKDPLSVTGGRVLLKRCALRGLVLSNNAALEALRMTNNSTTTATASLGAAIPFFAVQSSFNSLSLTGYKVWLGYNYISGITPSGNSGLLDLISCDALLVGNNFVGYHSIVAYSLGGTLKAYNNLIQSSSGLGSAAFGMYFSSSIAEIVNNTIIASACCNYAARGIYVDGGGGPITIRGNIIYASGEASTLCLESVGTPLNVSYCDFYSFGIRVGDSVVNCLFVDPNLAGDYRLNPGSPCIGKGPPEAIYNNRGTTNRNDMGHTGGPYWNPANYTNNNPMVFLLTGTPLTVFKGPGGRTNIMVNTAASAGH